jgi:hypothetical protein
MEMARVEISVPKDIMQFVATSDIDIQVKRNALLLYPYIENHTISHGKAAELLGMHKFDLINLYGKMGIIYYNMEINEVSEDVATIRKIRNQEE